MQAVCRLVRLMAWNESVQEEHASEYWFHPRPFSSASRAPVEGAGRRIGTFEFPTPATQALLHTLYVVRCSCGPRRGRPVVCEPVREAGSGFTLEGYGDHGSGDCNIVRLTSLVPSSSTSVRKSRFPCSIASHKTRDKIEFDT
jgi:hypothetical protein